MTEEHLPNDAQLALLSLLAEKPMHAYEITQLIEERGMREWTPIGFSSVYYALKKMRSAGWLTQEEAESEIGGPQRNIFSLTPAGIKTWKKAIIKAISKPHPVENPFLIGISAIPLLEVAETERALIGFLDHLSAAEQRLKEKIQSYGSHAPPHVHAMFDYSLKQIGAAITWVEQWRHKLCES